MRLDGGRNRKAGRVKLPHRRLVDGPSPIHAGNAAMYRLKGIALIFEILRHIQSPQVTQIVAPDAIELR